MTTQNPTEAAIEAMARAVFEARGFAYPPVSHVYALHYRVVMDEQRIAFHAQNGLVRVVPVEATDEMAEAANSLYEDEVYASSIDEANKVGDLTNPSSE